MVEIRFMTPLKINSKNLNLSLKEKQKQNQNENKCYNIYFLVTCILICSRIYKYQRIKTALQNVNDC